MAVESAFNTGAPRVKEKHFHSFAGKSSFSNLAEERKNEPIRLCFDRFEGESERGEEREGESSSRSTRSIVVRFDLGKENSGSSSFEEVLPILAN